ncbi:hypothetical protein [Muricoccus vinaceus]|uniref:Uncharacterized protein n=1 Tax=Muricoccus vinaceus TaxID=424704 RepID=A0ABV6IK40_9PROT
MTHPALQEASRAVGEDLGFQRRVWRAQRLGWAGMAVLVQLGLAGAFGNGVLAVATSRSADGAIEVQWERIERVGRDSVLRVRTLAPREGPIVLLLADGLAEGAEARSVTPVPTSESRGPRRHWLRFEPPEDGGRAEIVLKLRSDRPGILRGEIALDGSSVPLRLFVLP